VKTGISPNSERKSHDAYMADSPSDIILDTPQRSPTAPYHWPSESEDRRSRAPEFYGFVAWTSTYLLFVLYVLWALLPDKWIEWSGVTWYPNRLVVYQVVYTQ